MPPQCGAFSRDLQDKSQSPRYSPGVGGPWLQMTSALSECIIHIPRQMPVETIVLYRKTQSFGATLRFDPHFFSVKWDNSNHFGGIFKENVYGMYWHVVL